MEVDFADKYMCTRDQRDNYLSIKEMAVLLSIGDVWRPFKSGYAESQHVPIMTALFPKVEDGWTHV